MVDSTGSKEILQNNISDILRKSRGLPKRSCLRRFLFISCAFKKKKGTTQMGILLVKICKCYSSKGVSPYMYIT